MILNNLEEAKGKYRLLYVDPPWRQRKGGTKNVRPNSSGKPLDYPVISIDEIRKHLEVATGGYRNKFYSFGL